VKLIRQFDPPNLNLKIVILVALALAGTLCARAQTPVQTPTPAATEQVTSEAQDQPQPAASENNSAAAAETEAAQKRLGRARSLAAIGRLAAAASELETLRASSKDESVREVSRVLLMAIFVEMPDYTRAAALYGEANPQVLIDLSRVREKSGDNAGALSALEAYAKALAAEGAQPAWVTEKLAKLRAANEQRQKAEQEAAQAALESLEF